MKLSTLAAAILSAAPNFYGLPFLFGLTAPFPPPLGSVGFMGDPSNAGF